MSVSTISNVLNGRTDRMRADTLARVQTAIRALDYRPSSAARQLKTGHTPMLGLLVPSIANPMYGGIAREIETAAQERYGHRVVLGNTYRDRVKETGFFDDLLSHGVRGVVVISSLADEQHFEAAVRRGLVMVSYDRRATPGAAGAIDHVSVDNFETGRMAAQHLIAQGHRRLAFVTSSGQTTSRSEKIRGFMAAAQAAGVAGSAQVIDGSSASAYGDSEMADHVVCLAAATPDTENLFGAAQFAAMKRDAFFINASRGNLVDEAALLQALDAGQLAGCAIDVGRAPDQMPSPALARHPLVLATPHIGGLTPTATQHQAMETVQQVDTIVHGGIPFGAVNPAPATRLQVLVNSIREGAA